MDDRFKSPTYGWTDFEGMMSLILGFLHEDAESSYRLIVGTDSQNGRHNGKPSTAFVTAVVVHRIGPDGVGRGARYFYSRDVKPNIYKEKGGLRLRILTEASISLELMSTIANYLAANHESVPAEIHLDVGEHGETKQFIKEIVGMITGAGFVAQIKPNAYAASACADVFTKAPVAAPRQSRFLERREKRYAKGR